MNERLIQELIADEQGASPGKLRDPKMSTIYGGVVKLRDSFRDMSQQDIRDSFDEIIQNILAFDSRSVHLRQSMISILADIGKFGNQENNQLRSFKERLKKALSYEEGLDRLFYERALEEAFSFLEDVDISDPAMRSKLREIKDHVTLYRSKIPRSRRS